MGTDPTAEPPISSHRRAARIAAAIGAGVVFAAGAIAFPVYIVTRAHGTTHTTTTTTTPSAPVHR